MKFRFACFSAGTMGLASLLLGPGCAEGEEITVRGADSGKIGSDAAAGSSGAAGSNGTGTGGAGGTGPTGSGGSGGSGAIGGGGGISGSGGLGGGAGKGGSGGSTGGRGGSGGSTGGTGGATGGTGGTGGSTGGTGGATGGTGGSTGGSGGIGGTGGLTDAGSGVDGGTCPGGVSYCNDFERDLAGSMPVGWTRVGGSDGDWQVFLDGSNVFAQNHASSSTFRLCYPNGAVGAPWTGATTVSARVKILLSGSSGITTALLCMGYRAGSGGNYACLTLEPGSGARIRINAGSSPTDGPLWPAPITVGTWYDVKISMDASGALSAYLGGALLGTYMPPTALAGGYVAVATQSSQAAFDNVIVTQP